jgi:PhnB protein
MTTINPYLNFNGNCEEAFKFYKSVFGGEFLSFSRFKDVPPNDHLPASEGEWIMHVALPIGGDALLMGSDSPSTMGQVNNGNNFFISIQTDNETETRVLFDGLSAGGQVTMPLEPTFWSPLYGMFIDKFGIQWMINQEDGKSV